MNPRLSFVALTASFWSGCGPSATDTTHSQGSGGEMAPGSGGASQSTGGAPGTGGALLGTGGDVGAGGATSGVGGLTASGGAALSSGGDSGNGGSPGTGGSSAGGGAPSTPEIILAATFSGRSAGPYPQDFVEGDFGSAPTWNDGLDEGRAEVILDEGNPALRVTYPEGQFGPGDGGVQFKVDLGASFDELYLSYRVRFGAGFEFVKGGKLPGLVGGSAPTGCVADETGFSARMMWRTGGAAVQYLYFPGKIADCGDDYFYEIAGQDALFVPSAWHLVEHRIRMNTPGEADGIMQAWFDGELALDNQTFVWRNAGANWSIDGLYFSTFFGGSDDTWAPSTNQIIDYDDFIVSTAPIQQ